MLTANENVFITKLFKKKIQTEYLNFQESTFIIHQIYVHRIKISMKNLKFDIKFKLATHVKHST